MRVIAGLGNPGIQYQMSRHNAGFQVLDLLAEDLHIRVTKRGMNGLYGEGIRNGERILLVKPQTYMNLSGDCIQKILHYYRIPAGNLTVIYDDIDLPLGSVRIRASGSAGTHNGMRSVVACIGTDSFPRIRVGVGRENGGDLKDYVLEKPSKADQEELERAFRNAADAAVLILDGDLNRAQALFNKKHQGQAAR